MTVSNAGGPQPGQPAEGATASPPVGQPNAGAPSQGQPGETEAFYQNVLSAVPQEHHEPLLEQLRAFSEGASKKFQEHAQFRQQYEPYSELGITEYEPDDLRQVLALANLAQDEDGFNKWLMEEAGARGLLDGGDPTGDPLDGGEPPEYLTADSAQELIAKALQESLPEMLGQFTQERETVEAANREIDQKLEAIRGKMGDAYTDDFHNDLIGLARTYAEQDPSLGANAIDKAFSRFEAYAGQAESGLFKALSTSPDTPETGGKPNTAAEPIRTWKAAKEASLGMVRSG